MKPSLRLLAAAALAAAPFLASLPARAETPPDTLVQAWAIDDIISLDPAEIFEFTASEIAGNAYEQLIGYDVKDVSNVFGVIAESWTVSEDGKTISFKVREGTTFASGNPITAADAVFSLQRAVILDKSPAFILTQFGLTKDNVAEKVVQTGDYSFDFIMDNAYAPSFVLYCMTATVASVVDKALVMSHEADGDLGYGWLKTNYAGSGAFTIRDWRANEVVVMERNANFAGPKPAMARAIYRHIPEPATERLLLEKGDIDVARKLGPDELKALASNPDIAIMSGVKGSIYYLGLNQKNEILARPQVRQALKYLVDYDAIAETILDGTVIAHQAFLPRGFLGALEDKPFSLNVEKAKALLAEAGLADGFTVTMDTRNTADITGIAQAIQQDLAGVGIRANIRSLAQANVIEAGGAGTAPMIWSGGMAWIADFPDPSNFYGPILGCAGAVEGGWNWSKFCDEGLDAKATEADSLADPAKAAERLALWSEVYVGVMEQAPWAPVFNEERYTMKSERMGGADALYVDPVSIPINYDYVYVK